MCVQDHLFDGLAKLTRVVLNYNSIGSIGLQLFSASANLTTLREISLDYNKLTELEPWPLIRGQLVHNSVVNIKSNRISRFTNRLNWHFRCGMAGPEMILNLGSNKIHHLTDFINAWVVKGQFSAYLLSLSKHSLLICCMVQVIFKLFEYLQFSFSLMHFYWFS
jgi:hypothetical protein